MLLNGLTLYASGGMAASDGHDWYVRDIITSYKSAGGTNWT